MPNLSQLNPYPKPAWSPCTAAREIKPSVRTCSTSFLTCGLSLGAGLLKGFPLPPPSSTSPSSEDAAAASCREERVARFDGPADCRRVFEKGGPSAFDQHFPLEL